jgi:putative ATP-binding cassette transporter
MTPLQVIMNTMPQLGRANVALRTVQELGSTLAKDRPEEIAEGSLSLRHWKRLELRSVTYAYKRENEPESFILGPISLTIESGELVFITGGNGSGKTTFVKLITGLYMAETGHIYLDGQRVEDRDCERYRQFFSVVFADFYLFDHLLGLTRPDLEEEARQYLAKLKLSHTVKVINNRFSTTDLSQGQRKRLALLTAYLEDRPIYIFDECRPIISMMGCRTILFCRRATLERASID